MQQLDALSQVQVLFSCRKYTVSIHSLPKQRSKMMMMMIKLPILVCAENLKT